MLCKGQPNKAWIKNSIMFVWVSICVDSPTVWSFLFFLIVMNTHQYQNAFQGSAVQNSNHVSVFELASPLFDISSIVSTNRQVGLLLANWWSWPDLLQRAWPWVVSVRPAGYWHVDIIYWSYCSIFPAACQMTFEAKLFSYQVIGRGSEYDDYLVVG